jgi:hypothetical protein
MTDNKKRSLSLKRKGVHGKKHYKFGDKVIDLIDDKEYVVNNKMRGYYYRCLDNKGIFWKIVDDRLKRGWKNV